MPLACSRGQRSLNFTEKLDSISPVANIKESPTPAETLQARWVRTVSCVCSKTHEKEISVCGSFLRKKSFEFMYLGR